MVNLLVILTSVVLHADRSFVGQAIDDLRLTRESGVIDLSFARIDGLALTDLNSVILRAHGSYLLRLNCSGGKLTAVDASAADLRASVWQASSITTADFRGADLRDARLIDLNIGRCTFDGATLSGAFFMNVQSRECSFRGAIFDRASRLPFGHRDALRWGMIYVD